MVAPPSLVVKRLEISHKYFPIKVNIFVIITINITLYLPPGTSTDSCCPSGCGIVRTDFFVNWPHGAGRKKFSIAGFYYYNDNIILIVMDLPEDQLRGARRLILFHRLRPGGGRHRPPPRHRRVPPRGTATLHGDQVRARDAPARGLRPGLAGAESRHRCPHLSGRQPAGDLRGRTAEGRRDARPRQHDDQGAGDARTHHGQSVVCTYTIPGSQRWR